MQFTKTIENQPLTPLFIEPLLQRRLAELNTLLATKLKEVKKAPAGSLRVTSSNRVTQYYHKTLAGDTCGRYIPVKNLRLAKALAQKNYNQQLIKSLKTESRLLQNTLKVYEHLNKSSTLAEKLLSKLHIKRHPLIIPVTLPDQEFAKKWQIGFSSYCTKNNFRSPAGPGKPGKGKTGTASRGPRFGRF